MWHLMLAAVLFGLANARLSDDKCKEYHDKSLGNKVNSTLNEQFPHLGLLGFTKEKNGFRYNCPATLISESFVISPAYCLTSRLGNPKHVLLGTLSPKNLDKNHKILGVVETIIHPDYDKTGTLQANSLALIKFSPPLTSDDSIKPGCLYTKNIADNKALTDLLWAGPPAEKLFKLDSSIVPASTCKKNYEEKLTLDEKSDLCLHRNYPKDYSRIIGGTSHVYEDDLPKIVAIDNYGPTVPSVDYPDVSTKLVNYLDWIEKNVWK